MESGAWGFISHGADVGQDAALRHAHLFGSYSSGVVSFWKPREWSGRLRWTCVARGFSSGRKGKMKETSSWIGTMF